MRRLLPLLLIAIACAQPGPRSWVAPDGVHTSENPNAVYFFRVYRGSVADCPECLLFEHDEVFGDQGRVAYFISPESSCSLRSGDARTVRSGVFKDQYSVSLQLLESGKRELLRCAKEDREHEISPPRFLIFVGDRVVGLAYLDEDMVRMGLTTFFGVPELELIADLLRAPAASTVEL